MPEIDKNRPDEETLRLYRRHVADFEEAFNSPAAPKLPDEVKMRIKEFAHWIYCEGRQNSVNILVEELKGGSPKAVQT